MATVGVEGLKSTHAQEYTNCHIMTMQPVQC